MFLAVDLVLSCTKERILRMSKLQDGSSKHLIRYGIYCNSSQDIWVTFLEMTAWFCSLKNNLEK